MRKAQQLGRYQLLDRIAFGGMAEIYRAKTFDRQGRPHLVAVKRVLGHLSADDEFIKMLVDEAKLTALLLHDNIARLYEFSHTDDDEYFIAMEWVDGKDVRALLDRHRQRKTPMPPEHCAWIVMEVAHALDAAHGATDGEGRPLHLVHRDVSPSNMLCSYAGEVKLCDFGIAKATTTRVQTRTGVIKGKVKYMSPEQALGRKLDSRSDLFSLGSVLYEMLTLEAPFQAPTEVELIFAVRDAKKRDAKTVVPSVPEELNAIVNRAMTKSRSGRFQSGKELALALRLFLDRYKPGYRRSHFARFMRSEFAEEIEKELRVLEEFVVDTEADPANVGQNLLADVLGPDAIYTQFTAAATGLMPAVSDDDEGLPPLHAVSTRILDERHDKPLFGGKAGAAVESGTLHAQETRILTLPDTASPPPSDDDDEPLFPPTPQPDLHSAPTPVVPMRAMDSIPPVHDTEPQPVISPSPLHARPTQMFERPPAQSGQLHQLETRIIRLPDEDEESTSLPIRDEDIEE